MRNALLILVAVVVAVAMMVAPSPADAGNCGFNNFGAQGCHSNGFGTLGGYNTNFGVNGFFVAAPQPSTVFFVPQSGRVGRHQQRNINFGVNNFQGREFRQEIRRGPFGNVRRQTTTIR